MIRSVIFVVFSFCILIVFSGCNKEQAAPEFDYSKLAEHIPPVQQLQRVSTVVPWPRGIVLIDGKLMVLARGVHRSAGGPHPDIQDMAGHIFELDPYVYEDVVKGVKPSEAVRQNGKAKIRPSEPPFILWHQALPATDDIRTDRPYCTMAYDAVSRNIFICAFSGIEFDGDPYMRKNGSDGIYRYDLRVNRWHIVDQHRHEIVPFEKLTHIIPNEYYPHHDMTNNPPPHGLANGPDDVAVCGDFIYVVAKDNSALIQYDLADIRKNPEASPPQGRYIFRRSNPQDDPHLTIKGHGSMYVEGACSVAPHGGYLYVAFRTTSQVLRFRLKTNGDVIRPLIGEYIAQFDRYDPKKKGGSANIYKIGFDRRGALYVSANSLGSIWRIKPDPDRVFNAQQGTKERPYLDLRKLLDNPNARCGDFVFDEDDTIYFCSGNKDVPDGNLRGTIYRAAMTAK